MKYNRSRFFWPYSAGYLKPSIDENSEYKLISMGNGSTVPHQKPKPASEAYSDPSLVLLASQFLSLRHKQDQLMNKIRLEEGKREPNWSLIISLRASMQRLQRPVGCLKDEVVGRLEEIERTERTHCE